MNELFGKGMGLYIHIPFCVSKCGYCDFLSFDGAGADVHQRYVRALLAEMRGLRAAFGVVSSNRKADIYAGDDVGAASCRLGFGMHPTSGGRMPPLHVHNYSSPGKCPVSIDTVYIGGGTPTTLPSPLLCEILREVRRFNLAPGAEITLEMNPCTNSLSGLADYARLGVNRLSIGLQAWQDEFLTRLGRAHTSREFTQTMNAARAAGIGNINVDLMFGLPGQTMAHWQESIARAIAHGPQHISAYSLTPAENTLLWEQLEAGRAVLPSEDLDRAMYHEAIRALAVAGYGHYELSNFAWPGQESRHNVDCWSRKPYVGLGLGAHSFDGERRWNNTLDMGRYLRACREDTADFGAGGWASPACEEMEVLSAGDAMAEFMFLGLRMIKGVSPQEFLRSFGQHLSDIYGRELEMLTAKGLITCTPDRVALTALGLDLANQVFAAFLG